MKFFALLFLLPSPARAEFGFQLYQKLAEKPGNVFFSPYSITNALAMTGAGARGQTREEIFQVLGQSNEPYAKMKQVRQALEGVNSDIPTIAIANRLWGQKDEDYHEEFLDLTKETFSAEMESLDFAKNPEKARQTINAWVEERTKNKIHNLLAPGTVKTNTDLVLTNAIYFRGLWENAFATPNTKKASFYPDGATAVNANFLNITKRFFYGENEEFQALRLPYKGNDFAMTILLPKKSLAALKEDSLTSLRAGMKRVEVRVSLPKFRLEYSAQLREALTALGMKLAFTSKADFSGMRDPEPGNPYSLSLVAHKAFVEVDEKGTEAAAATAVLTLKGSAATQEPKIFRADKPFAFFIEHLPTNTVLFMGRLAKP